MKLAQETIPVTILLMFWVPSPSGPLVPVLLPHVRLDEGGVFSRQHTDEPDIVASPFHATQARCWTGERVSPAAVVSACA